MSPIKKYPSLLKAGSQDCYFCFKQLTKGKSKHMALVRSSRGLPNGRKNRAKVIEDRRCSGFMMSPPVSLLGSEYCHDPKSCLPDENFLRYFYSSRRMDTDRRVLTCSLEQSASNNKLPRFTALLAFSVSIVMLSGNFFPTDLIALSR